MKRIFNSAILLFFTVVAAVAQTDARITTTPENVLVYLTGAQIQSKGKSNLKQGRQTVVFDMLSNYVDPNSIQVKADASVTILSVNYALNYLKPQDFKEFKELEDSVRYYTDQNARLAITRKGYEEELTVLAANKSIGGANSGVSTVELGKITEFVRNRVQECALKKYEIENKEKRNAERMQLLNQQMNEMRNNRMKPTGEITVQLNAANAGQASFELSYYVTNCGWTPSYDIRVKDINSKAIIAAKANVVQNTGQDWKNVKLSLSTGNPAQGNTQPSLSPWWLSLTENYPFKEKGARSLDSKKMEMAVPAAAGAFRQDDMDGMPNSTAADFSQLNNTTGTNSIFEISIPYTIESNGKENYVEIQRYEMTAEFSYLSIPKLDPDAFLLARILGWDKSELLPGDASVYFENNYIGNSYFDTRIVDDTLAVALGRDNNVTLKRKQVNELNEKTSLSGNTKKISRVFEIDVRNTRKAAIEIEIEDQIPLSNNEQLIVDVLETGGAEYDKETGKLVWKLKLATGETKKLRFGYSVKYPRKMILNGL
jgi:uncharacterized protein (TIGR02231 family)